MSVVSYLRAGRWLNFPKRLSFTPRGLQSFTLCSSYPSLHERKIRPLRGIALPPSILTDTLARFCTCVNQNILLHAALISTWALPFLWTFSVFCIAISSAAACLFSYSLKAPEKVPLTLIVYSSELPLYILESLCNNSRVGSSMGEMYFIYQQVITHRSFVDNYWRILASESFQLFMYLPSIK